jgi:plasmid stabilization system protein ParE
MSRLRFSRRAERDLDRIGDYIKKHDPAAYGPIEGEIEIVRVLHGRRNIGALLSKRD